jgi:putative ABC transport system permease protein
VEADALAAGFVARFPRAFPNGELRLSVRPLAEVVTRDARPALLALGAAVGFVLLIASVNVANLMLVRVKTRERELAVRRALGATRVRLVRQLLAENLIFTLLGGASGLLLARAGLGILEWLRPLHLPRQSDITIDAAVVLATAALTIASSLFVGLVPAVLSTGDGPGRLLHAGRAGSLMPGTQRLHRGLVIAEVALSIVLLLAAGLMLRTFANLLQAPIGFDPSSVITAQIPLSLEAYQTVGRRSQFYRDAIARVRELPGVEAVSVGGPAPFAPAQVTQRYRRPDDPASASSIAMQQSVMPGYFRVLGIPLVAGRDISDDDIRQERRVAVIDQRLAAELWPDSPVGRRFVVGAKQTLEVVGVVGPIRARRVRDEGTPMIYVPTPVYEIEETLVVKTRAPLAVIAPAIKHAVESLGPGRPVFDIRPLSALVDASIADTRFTMLVLSGFAAAALLLAGVGLYGTLAYLISRRTQEFGVRLALGASATGLLGLVVREGGLLTGLGGAVGLTIALVVARGLRALLYGVTPLDGVTIGAVAAVVAAVAILAVIRPAWRAARIDPVTALRAD